MMLPFAMRVQEKIERIIDQELQAIGCQKLDMPILLPSKLWQQTGRWEKMGAELFRLKDRKDADYCLGPTHEEAFTSLVASLIGTRKHLPARLYQIGKKFRDEMNVRMGLMRAREFVMKDLYTFDFDHDSALQTYDEVSDAYRKIFMRIGLKFVKAAADTGSIGGNLSHEFHILSEGGNDTVLKCDMCDYAANVENAVCRVPHPLRTIPSTTTDPNDPRTVFESDAKDEHVRKVIEQHLPPDGLYTEFPIACNVVKLSTDGPNIKTATVLMFIRADRTISKFAIKRHFNIPEVEILPAGKAYDFLSKTPLAEKRLPSVHQTLDVYVDSSLSSMSRDIDVEVDMAQLGPDKQQMMRELLPSLGDFHTVESGDYCAMTLNCQGLLTAQKGIEIGHVFFLEILCCNERQIHQSRRSSAGG
jgi:prolyl-tRNA synthetase